MPLPGRLLHVNNGVGRTHAACTSMDVGWSVAVSRTRCCLLVNVGQEKNGFLPAFVYPPPQHFAPLRTRCLIGRVRRGDDGRCDESFLPATHASRHPRDRHPVLSRTTRRRRAARKASREWSPTRARRGPTCATAPSQYRRRAPGPADQRASACGCRAFHVRVVHGRTQEPLRVPSLQWVSGVGVLLLAVSPAVVGPPSGAPP